MIHIKKKRAHRFSFFLPYIWNHGIQESIIKAERRSPHGG